MRVSRRLALSAYAGKRIASWPVFIFDDTVLATAQASLDNSWLQTANSTGVGMRRSSPIQ